jgi:hypothetical protein
MGQRAALELGMEAGDASLGLDVRDDFVTRMTTTLQASNGWESAFVGDGIRKPEDQTALFEFVVNLAQRHARADSVCLQQHVSDTLAAGYGRTTRARESAAAPGPLLCRRQPPCGRQDPLRGTSPAWGWRHLLHLYRSLAVGGVAATQLACRCEVGAQVPADS